MISDSKREMEEMYKPLREWLEGNPTVDDTMKKELLDIVYDMMMKTIDSCYNKAIETLGRKK